MAETQNQVQRISNRPSDQLQICILEICNAVSLQTTALVVF